VIGNHVAERAGRFVKAPRCHADRFGGGDLDVVNVRAVPKGSMMLLAKRKTKTFWTVFFAEVVVDAVDLLLGGEFF
jgi:hypothetical protein